MSEYAVGNRVKIPCSVQPGAFSNERLITIATDETKYSGFVNIENLQEETELKGYIVGTIISIESEHLTIQIPVSLFTSAAGRTLVNSSWATTHLQAVAG